MVKYLSGFGNHFSTEAIAGSLPHGQNSPQRTSVGLYTEQLSGSSFTMPRAQNARSWLYRINPSVKHGNFEKLSLNNKWVTTPNNICPPNQLRWSKLENLLHDNTDFIAGVHTMVVQGNTSLLDGGAIHIYAANCSMKEDFFYNADAEMLFIPQSGTLLLATEFGDIKVEPLEIAVIPRGVKFQVRIMASTAYGYVAENYGMPFRLPDLGPIGSNCLANPRDFLAPVAKYEHIQGKYNLICKFEGNFWRASLKHSPLDVVAWHGNYVPYKYDLRLFNTLGSISYDHPDPSIFTVLSSPSAIHGLSNMDFVIFPPRWLVMENTFRPPWFHRNLMSEYMGLITGKYDAKPSGFVPGGSSLHNRMSAHGPDVDACTKAIAANLVPEYLANTMAFMLESSKPWHVTDFALTHEDLQTDYLECWQNIPVLFQG